MKNRNNSSQTPLLKLIMSAAGFLLGLTILPLFIFTMKAETDSMLPGLQRGQRIIISSMSDIARGDIVALKSPAEEGKLLVLRVCALEDETIEIRNKIIFINGKRFDPDWKRTMNMSRIFPMKFCFRDNMPPVRLGRGEYFVMGDNFDSSFDSRNFGKISEDSIAGRLIYSLDF